MRFARNSKSQDPQTTQVLGIIPKVPTSDLGGLALLRHLSATLRMEAWRQWLLGRRKTFVSENERKMHLTPTGLLMEGDYTQNPRYGQ